MLRDLALLYINSSVKSIGFIQPIFKTIIHLRILMARFHHQFGTQLYVVSLFHLIHYTRVKVIKLEALAR